MDPCCIQERPYRANEPQLAGDFVQELETIRAIISRIKHRDKRKNCCLGLEMMNIEGKTHMTWPVNDDPFKPDECIYLTHEYLIIFGINLWSMDKSEDQIIRYYVDDKQLANLRHKLATFAKKGMGIQVDKAWLVHPSKKRRFSIF